MTSGRPSDKLTVEEKLAIHKLLQSIGTEQITFNAPEEPVEEAVVSYVPSLDMIEDINNIFGVDGWSSSVKDLYQDYLEEVNGYWNCACSAHVQILLKSGNYHEDIGFGVSRNQKTVELAVDEAKTIAVSDGLRRALRQFGHIVSNGNKRKNTNKSSTLTFVYAKSDPSQQTQSKLNTPLQDQSNSN